MDVVALYEEALARGTVLSGYYNRNVRVETGDGPVIVRIRADGSEAMDLALWPEAEVLAAIGPHVPSAPRLLYTGRDPDFQIHEFIAGRRMDELAPDGKPLPDPVLKAVEGFFFDLLRVPVSAVPAIPRDWPQDADTGGFAERLLALVRTIRHRGDEGISGLYDELGVPEDPCSLLGDRARGMAERAFRLLHADIHRKNMILTEGGRVAFLDWELALWGDPVYDLADHLHKMAYLPGERRAVTEGWERSAPEECRTRWRADLDYYIAYEAVKSAVVDTVRWGRRIAGTEDAGERHTLCLELAGKLAAARVHWSAAAPSVPEPRQIAAAVDRWLA
ncbi:aminoglycoside phosphotransferase family protein [Streptomyces sp. ISL-44]|uniref:aminoglycoside phosphotransferase family protein n=1 Tax=Streptomyces sp. ISL-44 TaxID=2819184 RepID=UPI001BEB0B59|nr:aminoglycoside phosphotransferase family protein [Streptomyces sp. ISL-44]MBT2542433.1 aminoglycoside phosphotransferase family protein [Streptomyces sp. ISL-44]